MASFQAAGIASTSNNNFSLKASVAPVLTTARDPQDHVKAHLAAAEQGGSTGFCPPVPQTCLCCESRAMCAAHWQSLPIPQAPVHHSRALDPPSCPIYKVFSLPSPEQLCLCWDAASVLKTALPLLPLPLSLSVLLWLPLPRCPSTSQTKQLPEKPSPRGCQALAALDPLSHSVLLLTHHLIVAGSLNPALQQ